MWILLLNFLKNNWLYVILGLLIAGNFAYIGVLKLERDHYKTKANEIELEFTSYKDKVKKETENFEEMAFLSSKEANQKILAQKNTLDVQRKLLADRVKNDKTIRSINVPVESVRMLNESSGGSPTTGDPKGTGEEARAGQASTPAVQIVNLSTIFESIIENNTNHQKCINQVEGLQDWYNKLRSVSLANENPS